MKSLILASLLTFAAFPLIAEEHKQAPETNFDFWVGQWDLTWEHADGSIGKGTNGIVKILDDNVIQENFRATEGAYAGMKGISISVYDPRQKSWFQTWQDNQGSNINLTGEFDGKRRIFKTAVRTVNEQQIISRMQFYDIRENSLIWDWERSTDNGDTWELQWRINYVRRP